MADKNIQNNNKKNNNHRGNSKYQVLAGDYLETILKGDREQAVDMIMSAVHDWADIKAVYLQVFPQVQYEVGRLWQLNKISVAQEHYCTAVTQLLISQLFPLILKKDKKGLSMLGCCVGKELHEVGIRIVCDFFEMDGWYTYFVGSGSPNKDIIRTAAELKTDLICISVTMTYNVHLVKELIANIRAAENLSTVKIMVGGYPFLQKNELWHAVGADGFGIDAQEAVAIANALAAEAAPGNNVMSEK